MANDETISVLKFIPNSADHGKTLICRAENAKISGGTMEAVSVINVACKLNFVSLKN